MPTFRIPFSEIKRQEILPKGDYQGMIEKVTKEPNSAGDGDNLVWHLVIHDPRVEGATFRMWTSLKLSGLWRLEGTMTNLGLAEEGKDLDIEIDEETNEVLALAGLPVTVGVSVGKSQDGKRDQNNIDDLFGPEGRPVRQTASSNGSSSGRRPRSR